MLYRALGDVDRGVYIDIGAQDPDIDSVSKAFYERGGTARISSQCLSMPSA